MKKRFSDDRITLYLKFLKPISTKYRHYSVGDDGYFSLEGLRMLLWQVMPDYYKHKKDWQHVLLDVTVMQARDYWDMGQLLIQKELEV